MTDKYTDLLARLDRQQANCRNYDWNEDALDWREASAAIRELQKIIADNARVIREGCEYNRLLELRAEKAESELLQIRHLPKYELVERWRLKKAEAERDALRGYLIQHAISHDPTTRPMRSTCGICEASWGGDDEESHGPGCPFYVDAARKEGK